MCHLDELYNSRKTLNLDFTIRLNFAFAFQHFWFYAKYNSGSIKPGTFSVFVGNFIMVGPVFM